jgi:hypothetical protein
MIGAEPLKNGHLAIRHLSLFVSYILIFHGSPDQAIAEPYRFQTPERNIFCQITYRGLSCDQINMLGNNSESKCQTEDCTELRFFLPQKGKAFTLPRNDSMALFTTNTISAGIKLKAGSITCLIFKDALSCANSSNGSLVLKPFGYELNVNSHFLNFKKQ